MRVYLPIKNATINPRIVKKIKDKIKPCINTLKLVGLLENAGRIIKKIAPANPIKNAILKSFPILLNPICLSEFLTFHIRRGEKLNY